MKIGIVVKFLKYYIINYIDMISYGDYKISSFPNDWYYKLYALF